MTMQLGQIQDQRLILTQGLRASLQVLQMNCMELTTYLRECSMENPLLEYDDGRALVVAERTVKNSASGVSGEDGFDPMLNVKIRERDFRYELTSQIDFLSLDEDVRRTAHYIVYLLDTRGYLATSIEEIELDLHCGMSCVLCALEAVQSLEPSGVGARGLEECLLLQLLRFPGEHISERAILEAKLLPELAQKKYSLIAHNLNISFTETQRACDVIRSLNPIPCNGESDDEPLRLAIPEIVVEWTGTRYEAAIVDDVLPSVHLNTQWADEKTLDENAKKYIEQKTTQANELIVWVDKRRETLLLCAREIAREQQDFFAHGAADLRPMQMSTIAGQLGFHTSTVSRALSGKYLECRWGIIELSRFFCGAVDSISGGKHSTTSVQTRMAQLVAQEDKCKPLTDQALTNLLAQDGIIIARRTVAKYREALGIPSTQVRKI